MLTHESGSECVYLRVCVGTEQYVLFARLVGMMQTGPAGVSLHTVGVLFV